MANEPVAAPAAKTVVRVVASGRSLRLKGKRILQGNRVSLPPEEAARLEKLGFIAPPIVPSEEAAASGAKPSVTITET